MIFDPAASTISFTPTDGIAIVFESLKDINLPSPSVDDLDKTTRTTLAASVQLARSFSPGLLDNGEFTFEIEPQTAADITKVASNIRVEGAWTITFNGVVTVDFEGYMKSYDFPDPMEEQGTMEVTVKVDGDVTIAAVV